VADAPKSKEDGGVFMRQVGAKETRKLRAQRKAVQTVWLGFGMMGLVGWSVAIPTLLGTALGIWLDKRYPGIHSWTLSLLIIGLFLGCLNAWYWVAKEGTEIREELEDKDE
jgi:ATP synthase protein I